MERAIGSERMEVLVDIEKTQLEVGNLNFRDQVRCWVDTGKHLTLQQLLKLDLKTIQ